MRWRSRPLILTLCVTFILIWTELNRRQKGWELSNLLSIPRRSENLISLCSQKASEAGRHQKVLSYALYVKEGQEAHVIKRGYLKGINPNVQKIRELYPGWFMRIYTNQPSLLQNYTDFQSASDVFICDVTNLPIIGDLSKAILDGMLWRLLPMFDPTVDIFISRDVDSIVSERERKAVAEWENSDKIFHVMRDHPAHTQYVMGGLWGCKTAKLNQNTLRILTEEFSQKNFILKPRTDQDIIRIAIYSNMWAEFMAHDSYNCEMFQNTLPFPTQRQHAVDFVGAFITNSSILEWGCPEACRPAYGKDWEYC